MKYRKATTTRGGVRLINCLSGTPLFDYASDPRRYTTPLRCEPRSCKSRCMKTQRRITLDLSSSATQPPKRRGGDIANELGLRDVLRVHANYATPTYIAHARACRTSGVDQHQIAHSHKRFAILESVF